MMRLFKVKKRKVWHIEQPGLQFSHCRNSQMNDPAKCRSLENWEYKDGVRGEYTGEYDAYKDKIDLDYIELVDTNEIPEELQGQLCKACVMHSFDAGEVRIVAIK